jgi:hypothetical protein
VAALTPEQIQASQALAPKFDRLAAMNQARAATFKDRPLGALAQKTFDAFANFLIVSAHMMPESGYAFRPTPDVRNFGEQIITPPPPTTRFAIRAACRRESNARARI